MKLKGASPVIAILLIIVIAVGVSIMLYLWTTGKIGEAPSYEGREMIKVEGGSVLEVGGYTIITVYVRNIGDITAKVNGAYLVNGVSSIPLNIVYSTSSPPIWGGDVYNVSKEAGEVVLVKSGCIFYEDFRDGYNSGDWVTISTLESWQGESGSKNIDPTHGLVLTISRSGISGTEKYGLRLKNPLNIPEGEFIAEYKTIKLSGISDNYLAEVYFSQYATTGNPYSLSQFVATYINGWYPPITYSTATMEKRDKNEYDWDKKIAHYQSCGCWEARFSKSDDKVYIYYNGSYSGYLYWFSDGMYENPYIYLDVGIWSGESGTYSVAIPYVKVYRSLYVNVTGLESGWVVMIVDDEGNVVAEKTSSGDYVLFHRDNDSLGSFPLAGYHIIIVVSSEVFGEGEGAGLVIEPGEVKAVRVAYNGRLSPGSYLIRVVTEEGVEAVYKFTIRS